MSSIQSSIGLITGINIEQTVDQLMAIAARPRTDIQNRNVGLQQEQAAVGSLAATLLSLQFTTNSLSTDTFDSRALSVSDESVATASIRTDETPAKGSFSFTSLQTATTSQYISDPIFDLDGGLGSGDLSIRFGGQVGAGIELSQLNGGAGFDAGRIKLTDADGKSSIIDLRTAQTVDDVINAINESSDVDVIASTNGDQFVLTDDSGGSGTLRVQEVGGGSTAESLGLTSLSVNGSEYTGSDVVGLSSNTLLSSLNRGGGVSISDAAEIDDLSFTFVGESAVGVDLTGAVTLGDVVDRINSDDDLTGKLTAAISADGTRLELTALGNDIEEISSTGSTATDLGIATRTVASSLSGDRLISGLQDTLIADLNGGSGFDLGTITITDANSGTADVDLSSAETLDEVISLINAAGGVSIEASINANGDGIVINDTSGGGGTFSVTDFADGKETATNLGLVAGTSGSSVDSGSLNLAIVHNNTTLNELTGISNYDVSDIYITDSAGNRSLINLDSSTDAETLGDVIDTINNTTGLSVTASLNETGDGILLTDTAGGTGTLKVEEDGVGGTTAADLRILGSSTTTNSSSQQTISGSRSLSIDLSSLSGAGLETALSSLNDGNGVDDGVIYIKPASIDPADDTEAIENGDPRGGFVVSLGDAATLQDVVDNINTAATNAGFDVTAGLNSSGTGLEIIDNAGGNYQLEISDLGTGTTAADLNIAGSAPSTVSGAQTINGTGLIGSSDAELGALGELVLRINEQNNGYTASVFNDGSGYRLSITSDEPGRANNLLITTDSGTLSFSEVSQATDGAIALGGDSSNVVVFAEDNNFQNVVSGVDVTIQKASSDPVTIEVTEDNNAAIDSVQQFVDAYNAMRDNLASSTSFDSETFESGVLLGTNVALQVDTELSRILSGRFSVGGTFTSLESVGISIQSDGKLSLNRSELEDAFTNNSNDLEQLFTDEDNGLIAQIDTAIDRLAGDSNSVLTRRTDTLNRQVESNNARIETITERLDREREALLLEFFQLEETVARLQNNLDAIGSIQPITIQNSSNSNN